MGQLISNAPSPLKYKNSWPRLCLISVCVPLLTSAGTSSICKTSVQILRDAGGKVSLASGDNRDVRNMWFDPGWQQRCHLTRRRIGTGQRYACSQFADGG